MISRSIFNANAPSDIVARCAQYLIKWDERFKSARASRRWHDIVTQLPIEETIEIVFPIMDSLKEMEWFSFYSELNWKQIGPLVKSMEIKGDNCFISTLPDPSCPDMFSSEEVPESFYEDIASNVTNLRRLVIYEAGWTNVRNRFSFAKLLQKNSKSLKFIRFQRLDPDLMPEIVQAETLAPKNIDAYLGNKIYPLVEELEFVHVPFAARNDAYSTWFNSFPTMFPKLSVLRLNQDFYTCITGKNIRENESENEKEAAKEILKHLPIAYATNLHVGQGSE